ncbi:MAG TPA: type II toxin-antitoxin system prevent-host-death family antitoxin [Chloroflexota bacterium]|nr:type II toxin-antitoxin system prevent-host-death family antitoxin [Chloroflexota bacterium]
MRVGIRELKLRLSHYLALVRNGETVVVTDRGTPVARLERLASGAPPASVRHLIDANLLLYKNPTRRLLRPIRMTPGAKTSTDYVAEQRR